MSVMSAPDPRGDGYRFPWREGNHFELLVDGPSYFPAMLTAIASAQHAIWLEIYLVESGEVTRQFVEAFVAARQRGVEVKLLLDDFGARAFTEAERVTLLSAGVSLCFYNPLHYGELRRNLWRDHRKLLVIDAHQAFVGGTGLTDAFVDQHQGPWHDLMMRIEGPCVTDWCALFVQVWEHAGGSPLAPALPPLPPQLGGGPGRVTQSGAATRKELKRSLIKRLRGAERRIWLTTAYFLPSWKIRRLLRQAARRGVDVRLLLPGSRTDHPAVRHAGRRFYTRLLRNGVRIYEYQPRFIHAKYLLVDHWCSLGSSNFDRWNLHWNLEANQEVEGQAVCHELAALFEADLADSLEIEAGRWLRRPWYQRLLERFWGVIDLWLLRLRGPH